jgi:hypothetical protein
VVGHDAALGWMRIMIRIRPKRRCRCGQQSSVAPFPTHNERKNFV